MDPTATLADILDAFTCGDTDTAIESMENLTAWLNNGGLGPIVTVTSDDYYKLG